MYPTIIRYDGCYTTLFKCCRKRIGDYPHLSAWLADVHQLTVKDSPGLQVAPLLSCLCKVYSFCIMTDDALPRSGGNGKLQCSLDSSLLGM